MKNDIKNFIFARTTTNFFTLKPMNEFSTNHLVFFSPTHTSAKIARAIGEGIGMGRRIETDLTLDESDSPIEINDSLTVIAAPVYGGRVAPVALQRIKRLKGNNSPAIVVVVYGNRDYEDALLEMNDILTKCGFTVIASGAFVAQHSMAPEIGAGRPDGEDEKEIHKFAETVKNSTAVENVQVPGNRPYKPEMNMPVAPISLPSCTKCGKCVTVCPTNAISVADGAVITDIEKCILCMACTHICTEQARIRPLPLQQKTEQMLGALKGVRNKNEVFL